MINQCMGCQANWPVHRVHGTEGLIHYVVGGYPSEVVGCTADRYPTVPVAAGPVYYWIDDEGTMFASPMVDHEARGRCSGVPVCCIAHYTAGGRMDRRARGWGYVACPACVASGNRIDVRHCDDLRDACTCGQWADRRKVAT